MRKLYTRFPLPLLVAAALFGLGGACDVAPVDENEQEHEHEREGEGEEVVEDPVDDALKARIYATDPVTDAELTEVVLEEPVTDDGTLTGQFVNALNCLNKDGGQDLFGFAKLCVEEKSVRPDDAGSYLHVEPPTSETDPDDSFAELMMYHHVTGMHDYFRGTHGFEGLDFPLDAVVNVTIKAQGQWQSFPNAAFIPEQSFAAMGLPSRDFGAIMFGQGDPVDFSYDASVIFHEYTHAMVGTGRLQGNFADSQGLNNTPGAINEAVADYFAATVLDAALIGPYALGAYARDLDEARSCPEDLTTAIHTDGKIVGSALWSIRSAVGVDVADAAVFGAVQAAQLSTGFEEIGALMLSEVTRLSPDDATAVETILDDHGLLDCERAKTWENVSLTNTTGAPLTVEGRQSVQGSFPDGVPGYLQLRAERTDAAFLELEWELSESGGFFGGETQPISLALRSGESVELLDDGQVDADTVVAPGFESGRVQRVVVDGACADAGLYTLFLNGGGSAASVARLGIRELDAAPADVDVITCP